jgi:phosphatidylglycerophosphate synthase
MRAALIDGPQARRKVAGVSLLERMAVALHRGGAREIVIVGDDQPPSFRRLHSFPIELKTIPSGQAPSLFGQGEIAVADGALFAFPADVRRVLAERGRLVDGAGRGLALEVRRAGVPDSVVPPVAASRPAFLVDDDAALARAERELWDGLESPSDGLLDRWINRPLSRYLTRFLVHTPVTPNAITVLGTLVGLAGAALIAAGSHLLAVLGALVFQLSAAIDCADGDLARLLFKESRLGKWLDLILDNLVHLAIFAALAAYALKAPAPGPAVWLAASTAAGALVSLAVVIRGMRLADQRQDPRLRALIAKVTNRDFSFFVILFTTLDRPLWFLWPGSILAHVFWIGLLCAQSERLRQVPGSDPLRRSLGEVEGT